MSQKRSETAIWTCNGDMLWMSDMQCAFVQNWILCAISFIGRTFPCVEPAVGDVIVIKYNYHVKLHSIFVKKNYFRSSTPQNDNI